MQVGEQSTTTVSLHSGCILYGWAFYRSNLVHCRGWVEDMLLMLEKVFFIDVCASCIIYVMLVDIITGWLINNFCYSSLYPGIAVLCQRQTQPFLNVKIPVKLSISGSELLWMHQPVSVRSGLIFIFQLSHIT